MSSRSTPRIGVEVVVLWGDDPSVLHVGYVRPGKSFVVGSSGADFAIGKDALGIDRLPIVVAAERGPCAVVPPGATAVLTHGSTNVRLEELVTFRGGPPGTTREAFALTGIEGATLVSIADDAVVRVRTAEFTFVARRVELVCAPFRRPMVARWAAASVAAVALAVLPFFFVSALLAPDRPTAFEQRERLVRIARTRAPEAKASSSIVQSGWAAAIDMTLRLPDLTDAFERGSTEPWCRGSLIDPPPRHAMHCTVRPDVSWWVRASASRGLVIHGLIPRSRVRAAVQASLPHLAVGCRWRDEQGGSTSVEVSFVVSADGEVRSASVTSSSDDPGLDSCLSAAVRRLELPAVASGISVVRLSLDLETTTRAPRETRYGCPPCWDTVTGGPADACIL